MCATTTPGECTLRAAIMEADATSGPDTVTLAASDVAIFDLASDEFTAVPGTYGLLVGSVVRLFDKRRKRVFFAAFPEPPAGCVRVLESRGRSGFKPWLRS